VRVHQFFPSVFAVRSSAFAFGQQLPGQFVRLLAVVFGKIHLSLQL
jgi:hypothetical protein